MKTNLKTLTRIAVIATCFSTPALAGDCSVSLKKFLSQEHMGNSSMEAKYAAPNIIKVLEQKGYTIDENSNNELFAGFGCVLTDGEPIIKLSIMSMGMNVDGTQITGDGEGMGLTYEAADKRAFREALRKFSKKLKNCE